MGKGEVARNEQFLPFPQCFLFNQIIVSPFVHIFDIISLFAAELEDPKIGIRGKGLNPKETVPACLKRTSASVRYSKTNVMYVFLHSYHIWPVLTIQMSK